MNTSYFRSCILSTLAQGILWRSLDLYVCCREFEPEGDVQEATYQLDQKGSPTTSHHNLPVPIIFVAFLVEFYVNDVHTAHQFLLCHKLCEDTEADSGL